MGYDVDSQYQAFFGDQMVMVEGSTKEEIGKTWYSIAEDRSTSSELFNLIEHLNVMIGESLL